MVAVPRVVVPTLDAAVFLFALISKAAPQRAVKERAAFGATVLERGDFSATLLGAREHRETASCCLTCRDRNALQELLWPAEVELFVEHADCDSSWPWLCLVEKAVRSNELASWAVS